jgi:hypothetical protein
MDTGIKRILEFSADAQIKRREVAKDSPEFHNLTGAIGAFGKVLELLTGLQQADELCTRTGSISRAKTAARAR